MKNSLCKLNKSCVLSGIPTAVWLLSPGEGGMPLHDAAGVNCKAGTTNE